MGDAAVCDQCKTFADLGGSRGRDTFLMNHAPMPLPDGWLRVVVRVEPHNPATVSDLEFEVCSWPCAAERMAHFAGLFSGADA